MSTIANTQLTLEAPEWSEKHTFDHDASGAYIEYESPWHTLALTEGGTDDEPEAHLFLEQTVAFTPGAVEEAEPLIRLVLPDESATVSASQAAQLAEALLALAAIAKTGVVR